MPQRLGHRLEEPAHQQPADFLAHVDVAVRVAQHGKVARDAGHRLGDDVEVLGGVQRHPTPASAPRSRAHMPAQLTTTSQAMSPA